MKPPYAIGSVPSLSGHANAYRWRSLPRARRHRASKPQGSSERVLPWQITMDQLIFASLSHIIVASNQTTIIIGVYYRLLIEHNEGYDIVIGEERYIFVLQVSRDFLPCQYVSVN